MQKKDFLFFNYSWVPNSTFIFESFQKMGYSCDFVDEDNIKTFIPQCEYKIVVLYLHEDWTIPYTNNIINNYCQNSFLIQHDDTDFQDVQIWSNRSPDLIMQREYNSDTINPYNCPIYPFHFPIFSRYEEKYQSKDIDICFIANLTNPRRIPFIYHLQHLQKTSLSHLNWHVNITPVTNGTYSPDTQEILNRSKIGLHYFGNSYDSWRIWELASTKTAIIMPKLRNKSTMDDHMPFHHYIVMRDDFQDLEEKIISTLENNKYKEIAELAYIDYNKNHTPEKCFEKYLYIVKKESKLQ